MKSILLQFVTGLFAALFVVALYHRLMLTPAMRMAVVDVPKVYREHRDALARSIIGETSPEQQMREVANAKQFAERLPKAMDELSRECNCLLLDKSVVIGSRTPLVDLTEQFRQKVK